MKGTLEGLESSWDSPGMGEHAVEFSRLPAVGESFNAYPKIRTSAVESLRQFSPTEYRFRTRNTTYVLRLSEPVEVAG